MPQLGLVVPFYNEERTARAVAVALQDALNRSGIDYELALVADGSTDRTAEELANVASNDPRVLVVNDPALQGYGAAILHGFSLLSADVVGWTDGDGQVPPETVVELYRTMQRQGAALGLGRRTGRQDGWFRAMLSRGYNGTMGLLLGFRIPDINAKPKLVERNLLAAIAPRSHDWFIDTEVVAGAHARGARAARVPVPFLAREHGVSKVRAGVVAQYVRNLLAYRRRLRAEQPAFYGPGRSVSTGSREAAALPEGPGRPPDDA